MDPQTQALSAEAVELALQRRLTREERGCLKRLDNLYEQYARTGNVNMWELYALGYPGYYGGFIAPAALFPVPPKSQAEF